MKYLLITAAVALAMPAAAQSSEEYALCDAQGDFAEIVMKNRQDNISMADQIRIVRNYFVDRDQRRIMQAIVQYAYEVPRYQTREYRRNAVAEFRNDIYSICLKSFTKKD